MNQCANPAAAQCVGNGQKDTMIRWMMQVVPAVDGKHFGAQVLSGLTLVGLLHIAKRFCCEDRQMLIRRT